MAAVVTGVAIQEYDRLIQQYKVNDTKMCGDVWSAGELTVIPIRGPPHAGSGCKRMQLCLQSHRSTLSSPTAKNLAMTISDSSSSTLVLVVVLSSHNPEFLHNSPVHPAINSHKSSSII